MADDLRPTEADLQWDLAEQLQRLKRPFNMVRGMRVLPEGMLVAVARAACRRALAAEAERDRLRQSLEGKEPGCA